MQRCRVKSNPNPSNPNQANPNTKIRQGFPKQKIRYSYLRPNAHQAHIILLQLTLHKRAIKIVLALVLPYGLRPLYHGTSSTRLRREILARAQEAKVYQLAPNFRLGLLGVEHVADVQEHALHKRFERRDGSCDEREFVLECRPQCDLDAGAKTVWRGSELREVDGAQNDKEGGEEAEAHEDGEEDLFAAWAVQLPDEECGDEGEDEVDGNVDRTADYDVCFSVSLGSFSSLDYSYSQHEY